MAKTIPDDLFPPLSMAAGQMVLSWSFVEVSLDQWVAIIYQGAGGRNLAEEIPRALTRKIKFLRRCFRNIAALDPFAEEATKLLDRAKEISEIRHTVVHGYISKYEPHTQTVTFAKLDAEKDIHRRFEIPLTFPQLLDAGGKCLDLSTDFTSFTKRLTDSFAV